MLDDTMSERALSPRRRALFVTLGLAGIVLTGACSSSHEGTDEKTGGDAPRDHDGTSRDTQARPDSPARDAPAPDAPALDAPASDGLAPDAPLRQDGPRRDQAADRSVSLPDAKPDAYSYPVRARVLWNRHISRRVAVGGACDTAYDGQAVAFIGKGSSKSILLFRFDTQGHQLLAAPLAQSSSFGYSGCPLVPGTTGYGTHYIWTASTPDEPRYGVVSRTGGFDPNKGVKSRDVGFLAFDPVGKRYLAYALTGGVSGKPIVAMFRAFDEQALLKAGPKVAEQPPDGYFGTIRPLWLGKQLLVVSTGAKAGNGTGATVRLRYFPPPYDKRTALVDALPAGQTAKHRIGAAATDGSNIFISYLATRKSSVSYVDDRTRALLVDSQGKRLAQTSGITGLRWAQSRPYAATYHRGHYVLLVGGALVVYDRKLKLLMPATVMRYGTGAGLLDLVALIDIGQDLLLVYSISYGGADNGTWMIRVHLDGL